MGGLYQAPRDHNLLMGRCMHWLRYTRVTSFCRLHLRRTILCSISTFLVIFTVNHYWLVAKQRPPLRMLKSNNPFTYENILVDPMKNAKGGFGKDLYLLILVNSNPKSEEGRRRRDAIRRTWADCNHLHTLYSESKRIPLKCNCKLVFYVARALENEKNILQEARRHNDLLIIDYIDSYSSITQKQMVAFKWAVTVKPRFIVKADDDVFIHTPRLILELENLSDPTTYYGGIILNGTRVVRDKNHRHYISERQYKENLYPPYCKGSMYVFSGNLLPRLVETADIIPYMHVDDAYVGILMYYLGVVPQTIENFIHFPMVVLPFRYFISDCALKHFIGISDGLTGENILMFHNRFIHLESFPMFCFSGPLSQVIYVVVILCCLVCLFRFGTL